MRSSCSSTSSTRPPRGRCSTRAPCTPTTCEPCTSTSTRGRPDNSWTPGGSWACHDSRSTSSSARIDGSRGRPSNSRLEVVVRRRDGGHRADSSPRDTQSVAPVVARPIVDGDRGGDVDAPALQRHDRALPPRLLPASCRWMLTRRRRTATPNGRTSSGFAAWSTSTPDACRRIARRSIWCSTAPGRRLPAACQGAPGATVEWYTGAWSARWPTRVGASPVFFGRRGKWAVCGRAC